MSATYALSVAIVIAIIYMLVIRLVDINEREPLWAMAAMFAAGAVAAGLVEIVFSDPSWELNTFKEAFSSELGKFVAMLAGFGILAAVARMRGWSELNGLMDGVIYGVAVGLGFATGAGFLRHLEIGEAAVFFNVSPFGLIWSAALTGLAQGLFGAIQGAGFGAGVDARDDARRFGLPIVGLIAAILVHMLFRVIAQGASVGSGSTFRGWIATLFPLVLVIVAAVIALRRESGAVAAELEGEEASGAVTQGELALLRNPAARRREYAKTFFKGDFDGWQALRQLHNRQVQLALIERRMRSETDEEKRQELSLEEANLRAAITLARAEVTRELDVGYTGAAS